MSKICPNCLRPVRAGANYCGYCGTSLVPTPRNPSPGMRASANEDAGLMENAAPRKQRLFKGNRSRRAWIRFPIFLLIMVILIAMAIRYWPEILTFISQALPLLKLS